MSLLTATHQLTYSYDWLHNVNSVGSNMTSIGYIIALMLAHSYNINWITDKHIGFAIWVSTS